MTTTAGMATGIELPAASATGSGKRAALVDALTLSAAVGGFLAFVLPHGYSVTELQMRLAVLALLPATVRLRPWQTLRRSVLALVGACVAAAAVILVKTMWAGAAQAYFAIYGLIWFVVIAGYARTPRRRIGIVMAMFGVALLEFGVGWQKWVAGGSPGAIMDGSIHWRNQFAVFLLGPGLVAASAFALRAHRRLQPLALVTAVACGAGVVLSTSRAGLGLLVLGWLALGAAVVRSDGQRRAAVIRWLSIPILVGAAVMLMTLPIFFHGQHYALPLLGHGARGTGSISRNNGYRFQFMRAGVEMWRHAPVFGSGFDSFSRGVLAYMPAGTPAIFGCYDAWLDAFVSGGLVYGLPVAALGVGMVLLLARAATRCWRAGSSASALTIGAVVASAMMLCHVAFDADTYYPQVVLMVAILMGLVYAGKSASDGLGDSVTAHQ